jgi:hypothetical protein
MDNTMKARKGSYIGLGVAFGLLFGVVFGETMFGDVGKGIALSMCFGAAIGVSASVLRNSDT